MAGAQIPGGWGNPCFFSRGGGDTNAFVPPNFCITQSQSSDTKFSSVVFYPGRGVGRIPSFFSPGETLMLLPPNFCMIQSQSFVMKNSSFIFLILEVSDNKPEVDGGNKTPNNSVASLQ